MKTYKPSRGIKILHKMYKEHYKQQDGLELALNLKDFSNNKNNELIYFIDYMVSEFGNKKMEW